MSERTLVCPHCGDATAESVEIPALDNYTCGKCDEPFSPTQNPGGWPDAARETVEWALAVHFSGNRMPHMSGDPRNRLSPGRRRQMEDARDAVLDALAAMVAAREAAARREGIEAAAKVAREIASELSPNGRAFENGYANGALDAERAILALLEDGR